MKKKPAKAPAKTRTFPKALWVMIAIPVLLVAAFVSDGLKRQAGSKEALKQIIKLGGKTEDSFNSGSEVLPAYFKADFTGKPITDDDLAALRPCFLAARGPSTLNLSGTRVSDSGLAHLERFTFLHELIIDDTSITGAGMSSLKSMGDDDNDDLNVHISLARCKVNDAGLAQIATIHNLGELDISYTQVTGVGLIHLKALSRLSQLKLTGCPITDAGLDGMSGLADLDNLYDYDLAHTKITDKGLPKLMNVKHLRSLDLSGTPITNAGLAILTTRNSLVSIGLNDTAITDEGLKAFQHNESLASLSLGGTTITDKGILLLKANNRLTNIDLHNTGVNDATLRLMANWISMTSMNLEQTQITDAGLAALADLPNLNRLYLKLMDSKMTRDGIEALKRAKPGLSINY